MYTDVQIQAYNEHRDSYDAVWAIVKHFRTQRIGFGALVLAGKDDRCAIHIPVFQEDTGYGCGEVAIGKHPSIVSLYDSGGVVVCHAEEGVRVIDSEFADKVMRLEDEFVDFALNRDSKFVKRYMSGGHVHWRRHGRGYCYLLLIHPNARHRVARILGPFPLFSDVVRFAIVVGNWGNDGFFLQRMPGQLFHVVSRVWSPGTSMRNFLKYSVRLGTGDRVGGVFQSSLGPKILGYEDFFRSAGLLCDLPSTDDARAFISTVPAERVAAMRQWMEKHAIAFSDGVLASLLIASSALFAFNVAGGDRIKAKVRMWQVFGDLVCKHFVAMHLLATNGTVEDYSRLTGKGHQCNQSMSAAVVTSDLFNVCAAQGLSLNSKAWADILEGVIGVIAMTQPAPVLKDCLLHFHLIPGDLNATKGSSVFPEDDGSRFLNSGDWKRAAELFMRGKL